MGAWRDSDGDFCVTSRWRCRFVDLEGLRAVAARRMVMTCTPCTFTGFAERRHLISRDCTVETHVVDVLNTLEFEDVSDCVLVAHSYAGSVAPGVVAAMPQSIRHIIYLDALVVRTGESVSEAMGYMSAEQSRAVAAAVTTGAMPIYSPVADQQREEAKKKPYLMSAERQEWLLGHLSNMPTACAVNPVRVGRGNDQEAGRLHCRFGHRHEAHASACSRARLAHPRSERRSCHSRRRSRHHGASAREICLTAAKPRPRRTASCACETK